MAEANYEDPNDNLWVVGTYRYTVIVAISKEE